MSEEKIKNWFQCKECFRVMVPKEDVFEEVYKGQTLCVKCRIRKEKRNATKAEAMALFAEEQIGKPSR